MSNNFTIPTQELPEEVIYLDYAATTPLDPNIKNRLINLLESPNYFGNSSSSHYFGRQTQILIDQADRSIRNALELGSNDKLIFTSGATESINLAIKGISSKGFSGKRGIVTTTLEHPAAQNVCKSLEKQGFQVRYLKPDSKGMINPNLLTDSLLSDVFLVSLNWVDNEIGTIQNIREIGEICQKKEIILHLDGVQAIGKIDLQLDKINFDLLSLSGHKIYGPKGIGLLIKKKRDLDFILNPQIEGGNQERGRAGTQPTELIVALAMAIECAVQNQKSETERMKQLQDQLWSGLAPVSGIILNTDLENSIGNILNLSFQHVHHNALIDFLPGIAASQGSACTSGSAEPSGHLLSLGLPRDLALSNLRFSFGRWTTAEEIKKAIKIIKTGYERLRAISPFGK